MSGGDFLSEVALLNADLGNSLSDLSDNLEHQQSIENVLLDQRRAVSSVSIDEEVADLMRFQRSFQASSRVLNTLDKMLEIVVMNLVR
jgi:flagellar hook-associated protein 1 FlgK